MRSLFVAFSLIWAVQDGVVKEQHQRPFKTDFVSMMAFHTADYCCRHSAKFHETFHVKAAVLNATMPGFCLP